MWLVIALVTVTGLLLGRGIVAETSAHRRGLPDRWWGPECETCGSALTVTMTHCRRVHHRQAWYAAATPLVTAAVFVLVTVSVPSLAVLPAYLVFAATMVILTITDLQTSLIPNRILGPATVIGIGLLLVGGVATGETSALIRMGIGAVGYFGAMFGLAMVARGSLGLGDVKMSFIIGGFSGYLSLGSVVVAGAGAFVIGGIVAAILVITRRSSRKDMIPFGPFMTVAGVAAVVWGPTIVDWYLG